ncbi:transmembrane protein 154 isoform X1 [Tyto alba]|uniref:transmembrane protein 154 isoform X1 n=1 Tax=Tyto alba TaxID=56313 RepID=UPI001C6793E0|nr:transmembrane protein 154 isoform X1 [Tyto alba]
MQLRCTPAGNRKCKCSGAAGSQPKHPSGGSAARATCESKTSSRCFLPCRWPEDLLGTVSSENDGSGDGSPILPTTAVTPLPATRPSAADDHEPALVTSSATESGFETKSTTSTELNVVNNQDSLEAAEQSILIYVVPLVLLVLLILPIIFFVIHHKRKKSKQDELGSENVKSPIFEEDTPSVMEIEMEELDKWMNSMNKNADCECLPTVREEEKESVANPSDGES